MAEQIAIGCYIGTAGVASQAAQHCTLGVHRGRNVLCACPHLDCGAPNLPMLPLVGKPPARRLPTAAPAGAAAPAPPLASEEGASSDETAEASLAWRECTGLTPAPPPAPPLLTLPPAAAAGAKPSAAPCGCRAPVGSAPAAAGASEAARLLLVLTCAAMPFAAAPAASEAADAASLALPSNRRCAAVAGGSGAVPATAAGSLLGEAYVSDSAA